MSQTRPVLIFKCHFDARAEFEVEEKGWFEQAAVLLPNGSEIAVSFWDPVRLGQDLEFAQRSGRAYFAEPGLIIVPRVSRECMENAVLGLFEDGYFERMAKLCGPAADTDSTAHA